MKLSEWLVLPEDELVDQAPMRAKANGGYGFHTPCACQHRFRPDLGTWETTVVCPAHTVARVVPT